MESVTLEANPRSDVTLWRLFMSFATISTTAFGGAALPMMRREFVNRRGWLTEREFLDLYGIAQVSPGAIPVSLAVLIGRRLGGAGGFWVCLIGETVPGFIVLMAIALLSMDPHMSVLRSAIKGCAAAAVGLMFGNAIQLAWPYRTKIIDLVLMVAVGASVLVLHASLALVFLIFIPLTLSVQRLARIK